MESWAGLIPRSKFETPTSPNIIRESLLEDSSLGTPPLNTAPAKPMNTTAEGSQLKQVENLTKESTALPQPKVFAQMTDGDIESTADEEDDAPVQKTTPENFGRHESVLGHLGYSNHFNTTSLSHRNSVAKQRHAAEVAESPEPMQIDAVKELQVLGNMLTSVVDAEPSQARMNIGGVMQDIFVGEELGGRRL